MMIAFEFSKRSPRIVCGPHGFIYRGLVYPCYELVRD